MPKNDVAYCPLCATLTERFLLRENVPVHQNLLQETIEEACAIPRGRLDLHVCPSCGFVFNAAFSANLMQYGAHYNNVQSCSPQFDAYMDKLVHDMVEIGNVRNCTVVEAGCGKGVFLHKLACYPGAGLTCHGFDPAYEGPESFYEGRLTFTRQLYDAGCATTPADVVVCRHVIEHVPFPLDLLRSVRQALAASPHARIFFETPCVSWILRNHQLWDFFFEHCSYLTESSLASAFITAGFAVDIVKHVFGGQYLWCEGHMANVDALSSIDKHGAANSSDGGVIALTKEYAKAEASVLSMMKRLVAEGGIALWGAGAKGVTLANLVDPKGTCIDCLVDINPAKQGHFAPGTGHPIVPPQALCHRDIRRIIVMNPNYKEEVAKQLASLGVHAELVEIMPSQ